MRHAAIIVATLITSFALATLSFSGTAHAEPPAVESFVDNDNPFLGEQVDYVLRVYQGPGLPELTGQLRYESPSFAGFWNTQNTEQREYTRPSIR